MSSQQTKVLFLTVGATASFSALILAVLNPRFFSALKQHGYTHLRIQSGKNSAATVSRGIQTLGCNPSIAQDLDGSWFEAQGIKVSCFPFKDSLRGEMVAAREGAVVDKSDISKDSQHQKQAEAKLRTKLRNSSRLEGAVMSHAGSGSILEALRVKAPLIVVPNETLLDNHQGELADELSRQGYVVHGRLDQLDEALAEVEKLREKKRAWPPTKQEEGLDEGIGEGGLQAVMDDEMGFVD
ncbi:MAG: N-acetylglucosaminyldiphosphodolichol N-acetylglucosaminyltransferase catalytic subunit alg13 [Stictis urceolatum]|nr:N-acetylglucosaminyldiphosphodolichol N-acetylglucosaminyltransferase catalytic subunit alg13 [Stictis urceolata]